MTNSWHTFWLTVLAVSAGLLLMQALRELATWAWHSLDGPQRWYTFWHHGMAIVNLHGHEGDPDEGRPAWCQVTIWLNGRRDRLEGDWEPDEGRRIALDVVRAKGGQFEPDDFR